MLDLMKFVGYSGKGTSNYGQPQQPTTSDQNNHREIFAMYSVFDQFHVVTGTAPNHLPAGHIWNIRFFPSNQCLLEGQ